MNSICEYCNKKLSCNYNLNRHKREKHNQPSRIWLYKCLQECNISFHKNLELCFCSHLRVVHNFPNDEELLVLDSVKDFQIWLENTEEKLNVKYIKHRGLVCEKEFSTLDTTTYFYCSRSGKLQTAGEKMKQSKAQGSSKTGLGCTSYIKLVVSECGKFTAKYLANHSGHKIELQHLRLSDNLRASIANKLATGITATKVLDQHRDTIDQDLKRDNLLTRKDILNIKKSFNIQVKDGVRHSNDAVSVEMFVEECRSSTNNPIIFYKGQGSRHPELEKDDFCIIIMNDSQKDMLKRFSDNIVASDSTHGLNGYDFELTTLMVVDNLCFL